jgi:hypothetical protein
VYQRLAKLDPVVLVFIRQGRLGGVTMHSYSTFLIPLTQCKKKKNSILKLPTKE